MNEINVLMATDENYISQTRIAIWSARKYTDSSATIAFTVLCDENSGLASRQWIESLENELENITVQCINVDKTKVAGAEGKAHITQATFYKMLASSVLPDADQCLFIDSDLVVMTDLRKLYETDIEDVYAAGVREMVLIRHPNWACELRKRSNLPDMSDYINTGVILWNLKNMRRDHIEEKLLENITVHNEWLEQDIIHRICHERIKIIDYHYNYNPMFSEEIYQRYYPVLDENMQGAIIHFIGNRKPWKNDKIPFADVWWESARLALQTNEFEKMSRSAEHIYGLSDIPRTVDYYGKNRGYVIVGYSDNGIILYDELRKSGVCSMIAFCDNSEEKQTISLQKNVFSVQEAVLRFCNFVFINAVQNFRTEITNQLLSLGISQDNIVECSMEKW